MAKTPDEITVECPAPIYRFRVNVGAEQCWADTVSGLDNMPGTRSITLGQVRVAANSRLSEWLLGHAGTENKRDITINLMGEKDNELFVTWTVTNAFPSEVSGPLLDASTQEACVSRVVLQGERVTMTSH